jgi:hypothetical protein
MKTLLSKIFLRWQRRRLLADPHPFNQLMGHAVQLQFGGISDEDFRHRLDEFYRGLDPSSIRQSIDFPSKVTRLDRPGGYKTDISELREGTSSQASARPSRLWMKRFAFLRRIGIRSDVLILREGERIPPHGHHRVVSGFYVLEGRVAIRHYDRIGEGETALLLRLALEAELGPSQFTTNSESYQNVHWLQGIAPKSFLFRVTVVDTPSSHTARGSHADSRLYVDPTGLPDSTGVITAPYISEAQAKRLAMPSSSPTAGGVTTR